MPKYQKNFAKYILDDYSTKVFVYLPGATVKGTNYDKFRDTGYTKAVQNYITVKAWVREVSPNELILRQIGLVAIGAKKLVIKNNDVALFRLANKVVINNVDYYVYNDAVGKKFQIQELDENYSEVTIFRKDT